VTTLGAAIVAGLALGVGVLLLVAPRLWPVVAAGESAVQSAGPAASALRARLDAAGLARTPVGLAVAMTLLAGLVCGMLALALLPITALALGAAAAGAALPLAVLSTRARSRRRALRASWPDLVDHLVSGVRSGVPLAEAVGALAEVGPRETRDAFRAFGDRAAAAGSLDAVFDRLKVDLADPIADRVIETLRMAREVGGSELPAVLRALAASLRAEASVRSEVEARQSWVRGAARLGVAAPWVVLLLLASRPEAAVAYNSPAGVGLLVVGLVVSVVAYRVMIALGRLPDEPRWFA
jgi:tight adherence protein B